MINKEMWFEVLDEEIDKANKSGDNDLAETLGRMKTKSDKKAWRMVYYTCVIIGLTFDAVVSTIKNGINNLKHIIK